MPYVCYNTMAALWMLLAMNQEAAQPDLEKHRWKQRVIVVLAPEPSDVQYQRQINALMAERKALDARKGVVYGIWRNTYRCETVKGVTRGRTEGPVKGIEPGEGFGLLLLGLDGGVKWRSSAFVPPAKLWALIDAMPMRRAEIRNKGKQ